MANCVSGNESWSLPDFDIASKICKCKTGHRPFVYKFVTREVVGFPLGKSATISRKSALALRKAHPKAWQYPRPIGKCIRVVRKVIRALRKVIRENPNDLPDSQNELPQDTTGFPCKPSQLPVWPSLLPNPTSTFPENAGMFPVGTDAHKLNPSGCPQRGGVVPLYSQRRLYIIAL